jgi:GTP pyrophosphokinase/guanosine-3',5'-bis(diphosphate) 3'-pyrophosphohydrolase
MVVNFGKCCRPLPGDSIIGLLTSGKGIVVHRSTCRNVRDKAAERLLGVIWSDDIDAEFPAEVRLDANNQRGVLATVAATISEADSNISNVSLDEREGNVTTMTFVLTTRSRVHLARILRRLRSIPQVLRIARTG